jgi:hypothetical protein
MLVVADIEADGLDPDKMDSIHCMVFIEPETGQMHEFHDREDWAAVGSIWEPISGIKAFLNNQVTNLVGHNFTGYDLPVLEKVYGIHYKGLLTDTLVWSRCLYPDRPKPQGYEGKDSHGLGSWGHRLGRGKPEHNDWEVFTEDMLHRCREDVEINVMVFGELLWEMFCRNTGDAYDTSWVHNPPKYPQWILMETAVARVMDKQERDGVNFDDEAAVRLSARLGIIVEDIEAIILPQLPLVDKISYKEKKFPACAEEPFTKGGSLKANIIKYYASAIYYYGLEVGSVDCTTQLLEWLREGKTVRPTKVVTQRPMKIRSPQFKHWLQDELGWKPTEWNEKKVTKKESEDPSSPYCGQDAGSYATKLGRRVRASPKMTEDSYDSIKGDLGPSIKEFLVAAHRRSLVDGLLEKQREDGTLPAGANTCGAATTRMKHRTVVNIPAMKSLYGEDCRSLFIAREGRTFVGYDASALEARMEAHYTFPYDDGAYANEVLDGDIHTKNAIAFGLFDEGLVSAYNQIEDHDNLKDEKEKKLFYAFNDGRNGGPVHGGGAKGAKYCLTYGGGAPKLAETLNKTKSEGGTLFDLFWENNPALREFKEDVTKEWKENDGWIQAIDGRWLRARSPHSLVNLKFQSSGSIVCKTAIVFLDSWVKRDGLDAIKVIDMHDEGQYDCAPEDVNALKGLMDRCVEKAGEYWELCVATPSQAKSGKSWKETH